MGRGGGTLLLVLALAVVAFSFVLPVGSLVLESFRVHEVVLTDGRVIPAVGDVTVTEDRVILEYQTDPGEERIRPPVRPEQVAEVRTRYSLHHYRFVLRDPRLGKLVWNSFLVALGGTLVALLLGLPVAFFAFRTDVPLRALLLVLCLAPAVLPPFLVAMGGARRLMNALTAAFGLVGGRLQMVSAILVFGVVLFPFVVFLAGRALAAVPGGPWEAARLLGGRGAAFKRVVLPAVLPAIFGAAALVFVLAWSDFTVPDLLGFMLPPGPETMPVFPTEIMLQWKAHAKARAVATGAPLVLVTIVLLLLSLYFLRKSPVVGGGEGRSARPRLRVHPLLSALGWLAVLSLVFAVVFVPMLDVWGWAEGRGESVSGTGAAAELRPESRVGVIGDFSGALDRTPGSREDLVRWLKTGIAAALLAMFVATVLARWALRGGRVARTVVLLLGVLPLAVPGLLYTVGTASFWNLLDVPWIERTVLRSALALSARFLPFALLAAWVALRQVRKGQEEAAALLGAHAAARAWRIWGPPAAFGLLAGALTVLVLALREIDTVIVIDAQVFPLRIYDKIHYSRLADEANLTFLYVGILLVPALLAAGLWSWVAWRRRARGPGA